VADLYANLAKTAARLLAKYGVQRTFTRETEDSFNPVTGVRAVTESTYSGKAAVFDYNNSEIDGERVQAKDKRVLLEAVSTAPIIGDSVSIDSADHSVLHVKKIAPAGTVVCYELQVRA